MIGVGGYLGFNEHNAAISFSSLKLTRDANNNPVVHVNVTKDQLKASARVDMASRQRQMTAA